LFAPVRHQALLVIHPDQVGYTFHRHVKSTLKQKAKIPIKLVPIAQFNRVLQMK
jgi:hypothetical protein